MKFYLLVIYIVTLMAILMLLDQLSARQDMAEAQSDNIIQLLMIRTGTN